MSDWQRLRAEVRDPVAPGRMQRWWEGSQRRAWRGTQRRLLVLGVAAGAAAAFLVLARPRQAAPPERRAEVVFADGSRAALLSPSTVVTARLSGRDAEISAGRARFLVRHDAERPFRVVAGAVVIDDLGTVFVVDRRGPRTAVSVEEGRVRVSWSGGAAELGPGEAGLFPPEAPPAPAAASPRAQARAPVPADPHRLLRTADLARRAGRPAEALPPLRQIYDRHPEHALAPVAAFTAGRVLMDDLRRPREAALAFAAARRAQTTRALREDALAREALAWAAAGDATQARTRAAQYLERHPSGKHRGRMRLLLP